MRRSYFSQLKFKSKCIYSFLKTFFAPSSLFGISASIFDMHAGKEMVESLQVSNSKSVEEHIHIHRNSLYFVFPGKYFQVI